MAISIFGDTLTDAWLADLEYLQEHGEQLNLVTTIADPDPDRVDARMMAALDEWLLRRRKQRVETVANTIFPQAYLRGCASRQEFYERYLARRPRLLKLKRNRQGTYFGRLVEYPASADVKRGDKLNQIEVIIQKLQKQLGSGRPKRFAYLAQIFVPGQDEGSVMGFPCLSFVSFQLDGDRLCLTAVYRNQYYFERALGNFLGLARLQRFVAEAVGLKLGKLTVHACHAEINGLGKRAIEAMIRDCRQFASAAIAA